MKNGIITNAVDWRSRKIQGRYNYCGLPLVIENQRGSYRQGIDPHGNVWRSFMHADYGYVRSTEGVDGDAVDVYVGPAPLSPRVFIVHQNDPKTKQYDEDKCMLGYGSPESAKASYLRQYDSPKYFGTMTEVSMAEFKTMLKTKVGLKLKPKGSSKVRFAYAGAGKAKTAGNLIDPIEVSKAKRMPIGTVSNGRKKVAEGKWVPVSSGKSSTADKVKVTTRRNGKTTTAVKDRKDIGKDWKLAAQESIAKEFGVSVAKVQKVSDAYRAKYPKRVVNIDTVRALIANAQGVNTEELNKKTEALSKEIDTAKAKMAKIDKLISRGKKAKSATELKAILADIKKIRLEKAKRMAVGTVSHGRKKVAEGKWVPVKKTGKAPIKKSRLPDIEDLPVYGSRTKVLNTLPEQKGTHVKGEVTGKLESGLTKTKYEVTGIVYRGVSLEDYNRIKAQGYINSDMRGAISYDEGTNLSPSIMTAIEYLPEGGKGVVLAIDADKVNTWGISADDYVRTNDDIPLSAILKVSAVFDKQLEQKQIMMRRIITKTAYYNANIQVLKDAGADKEAQEFSDAVDKYLSDQPQEYIDHLNANMDSDLYKHEFSESMKYIDPPAVKKSKSEAATVAIHLQNHGLYIKGKTHVAINPKELSMGIKVEMEHSTSEKVAKEIALDHLVEDKDYYTHLKKMEKDNEGNKPKMIKKSLGNNMNTALELLKAKYKRRWKGKNGKWVYDYRDNVQPREAKAQGGQVKSLRGVSPSEARKILHEFRRRAPGEGKEKTIQTAKALEVILTRSTFCMVSAGLSPDEIKTKGLSKDDVKARHSALLSDLTKKGYIFTSCRGKYGAPEESVMVMTHDADMPDMLKLGAKYKQDSVLFVKQGKTSMVKTTGKTKGTTIMAGVGHDYDSDATDFYTKVPLGNGANIKFAMRVMEKALRAMSKLILGRK